MKRLLQRLLYSLRHDWRDWTVFFLSLLLAFSIWILHNLSLDYSGFLTVRMAASCPNIEGHTVQSSNICDVVARCRTSGYNIIKSRMALRRNPVQVPFDRQSLTLKSGEIYYITRRELNESAHHLFGEKVEVEYFLTDTLYFRFPYETSKKVPVFPVMSLSFEPQYMSQENLEIVPDSVRIYGEPYHLANVDRVFTEPIKLQDLKSGAAGVARIERIKGVRLAENEVHYSIEVTRYVEITREVTIEPVNVPPDKEMMIYPSKADVVFKCVFPLISDVGQAVFQIDYEDYINSRSRKCIPVPGYLPDGVLEYEIFPEIFECVLTEK